MQKIREMRVVELNRLLPIAREIVSLKNKENEVSEKLKKVKEESKRLKSLILELDKVYEIFVEKDKKFLDYMIAIKDVIKNREKKNEQVIKSYSMEMKQYRESYEFQENLCKAIVSVLPVDNGFLEKQEIKEVYIKEYTYLMCLAGLRIEKLTKEKLFAGQEAEDEFFNKLDELLNNEKLSGNSQQLRSALVRGVANEEMFFKCFF